jgi:Fungal Transforming acidic coiled-coil (TACC) proteins
MSARSHPDTSEEDEYHDTLSNASTSPYTDKAKRLSSSGMPSPIKLLSPVKKQPADQASKQAPPPPYEPTIRFNEGLTKRVESSKREEAQSDCGTVRLASEDEGMSTNVRDKAQTDGPETGEETQSEITLSLDDTMNDISAFSAIPQADLTRFAALRDSAASPTRTGAESWSPSKQLRNSATATPPTAKRALKISNLPQSDDGFDNEITPRDPCSSSSPQDLLNFTGQSNVFIPQPQSSSRSSIRRSPSGRGGFPIRINPSPTHPSQAFLDRERSRGVVSPVKQTANTPLTDRRTNLLDFDLEPIATPRSIPCITPRELESLRSELSSQISSLSATLSGKEAEVLALKHAITDAEVRVGNTSEELRNEKSLRENLEQEKVEWDHRSREMENVLREIRQEIMVGEHERDKLRRQTEEAEKRTEEMEVNVVELQTRLESANQRTTLSPNSSPMKKDGSSGEPPTPAIDGNGMEINEAVREATERVARDLHALYKSKHETKVAALKKSYEARWEKKVRHLEEELKLANTEILNLKTERDATMSGPLASSAAAEQQQLLADRTRISETLAKEKEQIEAEKKMLGAKAEGLESEVQSFQRETEKLREQLEKERIEKGELVAQVDLFLALGDNHSAATPATHKGRLAGEARMRSVSSDSIAPSSLSASRSTAVDGHPPPQHQQQQQQQQSPARPAINGRAPGSGRPRPMSMLQPPGKFSGIPGPGGRGPAKALPPRSNTAGGGGGGGGGGGTAVGIMEGIAKMGAGGGATGGGGRAW